MKNLIFYISVYILVFTFELYGSKYSPGVPVSRSQRYNRPTTSRETSQYSFDGNLIVTGNVGGGRHFRGTVPYRSSSDISAPTGTDDLSSFYRRTTGQNFSTSLGRTSYTNRPYYLRSQSVTGLQRNGQPSVGGVSVDRGGGLYQFSPDDTMAQRRGRAELTPLDIIYPKSEVANRPLSPDIRVHKRNLDDMLVESDLGRELRRTLLNVDEESVEKDETAESSFEQEPSTKNVPEVRPKKGPQERDRQIRFDKDDAETEADEGVRKDIRDKMEEQIQEQFETRLETMGRPVDVEDEKLEDNGGREELWNEQERDSGGGDDVSDDPLANEREWRDAYKLYNKVLEQKYNQYIQTAESYMGSGEYYKAADTYVLAGGYDIRAPEPYVGRAHALLAAGEYMSAAYYLGQTMRAFDDYEFDKMDIDKLIRDQDLLEERINDLQTWQEKTDSPELGFLLAYTYYQTDRLDKAREAIDAAAERLIDDASVSKLKEAIESRGVSGQMEK